MKQEIVQTTVSQGTAENDAARAPKILSLCCLYPNPVVPGQGLFIQRRLQHLAELTDLRVVAPFAVVQYGSAAGKRIRIGKHECPETRRDGKIPVYHPRWFYPPFSGSWITLWLFLQLSGSLRRIRKEFDFEILDTHFGHPEGIVGAMLSSALGIPFTMTFRGNEPKHSQSRLGRFWMVWAVRRASRVFAVSSRLRDFAVELGADPSKAKVIPNGIDPAVFFPRGIVKCRAKYGFAADRPLIVSAGALVERKGHHRIIEALKAMSASGSTAQLAIAGGPGPEGQYEAKLRSLVSELGLNDSVRFLGAVSGETMAEVMSAADLVCLASTNEGWPNVVHEALACGAPVVATDVGAVPDMLGGGRRGLVIPVNDPERLKEALEEALLKNWDREAISAWGRSRNWHHVAAEVFDEMQAVVAEQAAKRAR